jgi:phytoene dehydrogenase-like protein
MSEQNNGTTMVVPAFRHCPELRLQMTGWQTAMQRFPEAKTLAASNYLDLEFTFQEAWRESKRNAIQVGDALKKAKQNVEEIKADIIFEEIPKLMKTMPKGVTGNADFRKAVIARNEDYKKAQEHVEKLEAMLEHFESHMKIMENTSRFLKKQMDYFKNLGISSR